MNSAIYSSVRYNIHRKYGLNKWSLKNTLPGIIMKVSYLYLTSCTRVLAHMSCLPLQTHDQGGHSICHDEFPFEKKCLVFARDINSRVYVYTCGATRRHDESCLCNIY